MSLIAPGSPPQLMIALFICVAYMCLVLKTMPFEEDLDDWLSFITECQLSMTMFIGFAIITDSNRILNRGALDSFLLVVNCCGFVAFFVGGCAQSRVHVKVKRLTERRLSISLSQRRISKMGLPNVALTDAQTTKGAHNSKAHSTIIVPTDSASRISIMSPAMTLKNSMRKSVGSSLENDFSLQSSCNIESKKIDDIIVKN